MTKFMRWEGKTLLKDVAEDKISSYLDAYPDIKLKPLPSMSEGLVYQGVLQRGDFSLQGSLEDVPLRERSSLRAHVNNKSLQQNPSPKSNRIVIDFFDDLVKAGLDSLDPTALTTSSEAQLEWLQVNRPYLLNQLKTVPAGSYSKALSLEGFRKSLPQNSDNGMDREYWWRHLRPRVGLRSRWKGLDFVTVFGRVSKVWALARVLKLDPTTGLTICPTSSLNVSPNQSLAFFGTLSSFLFEAHVRRESSTLNTSLSVSPTDSIPTFPVPWKPTWDSTEGRPTITQVPAKTEQNLGYITDRILEHRQSILDDPQSHGVPDDKVNSQWGPTKLYNMYDDPDQSFDSIETLRALHEELLERVLDEYGWDDLVPDIEWGFDTPWLDRTSRYVPDLKTRRALFGRLETLNEERYEEEIQMILDNR